MSDVFLFALMTLASYRLWRIPGNDDWPPSRALRGWLASKATSELGDAPTWTARWWWQETETMVECPWCAGSWCSFAVVAIVAQVTSVPLPVLQALAVACAVGLVGSALDG